MTFLVGLDDTDIAGSPGTNQLARQIAEALPAGWRFRRVVRHQLLSDPRVPCTTQNGCASLWLEASGSTPDTTALWDLLVERVRAFAPRGSDPGLALAPRSAASTEVEAFGLRAQREIVQQDEARALAATAAVRLVGLGGTEDGVIGALAAIGLAATGDDGRVVHAPAWPWPDLLCGWIPAAALLARGVAELRDLDDRPLAPRGWVDVGKHLRPAVRSGRIVLYVAACDLPAGDQESTAGPDAARASAAAEGAPARASAPRYRAVKLA